MTGRIDLDFKLGSSGKVRQPRDSAGDALRILVLADLSGRRSCGAERVDDLASRSIRGLDIDRYAPLLHVSGPALRLADGTTLGFEALDDFHPDQLCARVTALQAACASRARLLDATTCGDEVARIDAQSGVGPPPSPGETPRQPAPTMLEQLLGGSVPAATQSAPKTASIVDDLIRRVVQPSSQPASTREPTPYVSALESNLTEALRAILHDPEFQSIESAWRGLRRFVEAVDLGAGEVEVHVADISKAELLADAAAHAGNATNSGLYGCVRRWRTLTDETAGRTLVVGHFSIDATAHDLALLAHLGSVGTQLRVPFIAAASPGLAGAEDVASLPSVTEASAPAVAVNELWSALRRSPIAAWIGLTLPRILLRQPYGARSDAIEAFPFEELGSQPAHSHHLWGSGALACAQALAEERVSSGEFTSLQAAFEIGDLPTVLREVDGERVLLPCAEVRLSTDAAAKLAERGFITLVSHANRNVVRVMGLRSIATRDSGLSGLD